MEQKLKITDEMMKAIRVTAERAVRNTMKVDPESDLTRIHGQIIDRIVADVVDAGIPVDTKGLLIQRTGDAKDL